MMNKEYHGIYAALVTPYHTDGSVNYPALKELVRYLLRRGIDGFYVGGSTAEAFLLSGQERRRILETVIEENNGARKIICHVGAISTDLAISFAKHAKSAGADAVSAISPFYYKFSEAEIIRYYLDIMSATDLPMFVYNFPNFSGFSLSERVLDALKCSGTLRGVKYTSSDMFLLERLKTKNPDLVIWNGFDEMLLAGLSMGADGGIGSTYNCMTPLVHRIYDSFCANDIQKAQRYQQEANEVIQVIVKHGVFASVKTLLGFEGLDLGSCRKPFAPMTEEGIRELREVYERRILPYME